MGREEKKKGGGGREGGGRGKKMGEMPVRGGGQSLSPLPSDLTAPSANPLKIETVTMAHKWNLKQAGGYGGGWRLTLPSGTCISVSPLTN